MNAIFTQKWTKLSLTLVACALLTACSSKKEADLSAFHQGSKTETTQAQETKKDKSAANETATESETSKESSQSPNSKATAKQAKMDVQALANGDYSSVSGTWENYQGLGLIFNQSGLIAWTKTYGDGKIVEKEIVISSLYIKDGNFIGSIGLKGSLYGGAAIAFVPAGVQTLGDKLTYAQDVILVGQSVNAEYEPFYKVSDSTSVPESVQVDESSISEETSNESPSNLAASGTYTFTKNAPVRAKASLDAPIDFTYGAGQSVYYDKTFVSEGKTWISYVSSSGTRRYVVID